MKRNGSLWGSARALQNKANNKQTKENSMKQSTKRIFFTALAAIFLLAACAPAQVATPNPAEIANQVATSVALTVASQNLETQQAAPQVTATPIPTDTPAVIDTPTPIVPTATAFVIVAPTNVPSGGGGGTVVQADYECEVISRRPFDYAIFKPGDEFDVKWTIVNSGRKTMIAGLDLKYNSGEQFVKGNRVELPELKPGDETVVVFDAVAPNAQGKYIMTFVVEGGLCYPYAAIEVEK
jgi:hypothetical protein